jgi:N-acetylglucosamine kinase-like BadF-type ATPase
VGVRRAVLAVDGGGTKTDVALIAEDGSVLAFERTASHLPQVVGAEAAVRAIDAVVDRLRRHTGEVEVVDAAVFLSGADFPSQLAAIERAVADAAWAPRHLVDNDVLALLRAGTAAADAVAVVCGTGINAVGVAADGRVSRFPAVGRSSGDWGGGTDLALEALWHAARAEDGRGPATSLRQVVPQRLGFEQVVEVSEALELGRLRHADLGVVTPVLFAEAAAGDPVAVQVVERQAEEIALLVRVLLRRLGLLDAAGTVPVVLGGSVLAARHALLLDGIARRTADLDVRYLVVDEPPVLGAVLLALDRLAGSTTPRAVADRVRAGLADRVRPTTPITGDPPAAGDG